MQLREATENIHFQSNGNRDGPRYQGNENTSTKLQEAAIQKIKQKVNYYFCLFLFH